MPSEPSYLAQSAAHRVSRKLTSDDEIDIRRSRGEISCAECRRLKLKCDKKLPCGSCTRRGCPSICPNGSLSSGQGTRFVLADTAQLHAKIAEMGQRIRQLEDALAIFQSGVSSEPHPLLRDELLAIKFGPDVGQPVERKGLIRKSSVDSIDALGTLTIGDHGEVKYFGRSAGSEALFLAGAEMEDAAPGVESDRLHPAPSEVPWLSNAFPFGVGGNSDKGMDILFDSLPPQPRAWSLCETYLEHATWMFRPIKRDELVDDILIPIYKSLKARRANESSEPDEISPHKLAVLFLVFAIGALVDLTLEPYNAESEKYYHLSMACLSLRSVFESPEISTVQAVVLLGACNVVGGKRQTLDSTWVLTSLGCKLAQSIGLHRDSARFDLDAKTVQRRRSLFWELFSMELFYSLATGRPPSVRLSYIDCEFPEDDEATMDKDGNILKGYYRWKYEFTKEVFSTVTELTLTAEPPNYQTVLELDRKVREKTLPPHLNVFMSTEDEYCTPAAYMRGCLLGQYRTIVLLYIHRSFFAQAMLDHPINPLRSPYAPSFLAAYRCASGVIKSNLNYFDKWPDLCCRWWAVWTHLFSAAIIVGCIVTRSPSSSMAPSAFIELGLACDMFEKGAKQSRRARNGLRILSRLRERAFQVYSQFRSGNTTPGTVLSVGKPDYGDDELALFGGQTRVLVSKLLGHKHAARTQPASPGSSDYSGESEPKGKETTPDVHPSLVEYLSSRPLGYTNPPSAEHLPPQAADYSSENVLQQHTQYVPSEQELQSLWQSSALFPTTHISQPSHVDDSYTIPPDVPFAAVPTYGDPVVNKDSPENLVDLGMMMTGDSGMDQQWMSFMRDSGLLDVNLNTSAPYGPPLS
ncbi:putative fungal specific transcription factor [Lyophyllum shimeji]|uniref:Fungal specific transcription factor n=1 Tax=Lyophyllum shimeji TaxID=47721 RepID=A0A9P3PD03_LYOSH|nr:putative fungal specific transcription factor [Lyophyllum shimeji]